MERFRIGEAVRYGWDVMANNIFFFIVVIFAIWVAQGIPSSLQAAVSGKNVFLHILFAVVGFVVGIFVEMAYIKISLRLSSGEKADYRDLYSAYPSFADILLGTILYVLIVTAGLILLIVPGIIWAIKYQYYGFLIIDGNLDPFEALKKSGEITKGEKWHLFALALAFIGIIFLGALACFVGIFAAIPTALMANVYVYRRLLESAHGERIEDNPPAPAG